MLRSGPSIPKRKGRRRAAALLLLSALSLAFTVRAAAGLASTSKPYEVFSEDLLLRPLSDGRLHASFAFTTLSYPPKDAPDSLRDRYELLPRTLMQIAHVYNAHSLHLALNTGRWDYGKWGWPIITMPSGKRIGEDAVGAGAEIWSRLRKQDSNEHDDAQATMQKALPAWRGLTASLAGLFCASLDAVDEKLTVIPSLGFGTHLPPSSALANSTTLLHAFLATESVCTENLTPFVKLLPCRASAGLASLLRPHELFGSDFHGMTIHLERAEPEGAQSGKYATGWKLDLKFQAVFSPVLSSGSGKRDWSLSTIFGQSLERGCPLASSSNIIVAHPASGSGSTSRHEDGEELPLVLQPLPIEPETAVEPVTTLAWPAAGEVPAAPVTAEDEDEEKFAEEDDADEERERHQEALKRLHIALHREGSVVYNTRNIELYGGRLDVNMTWPSEPSFDHSSVNKPPAIVASRSLTGYGQERGHIEVQVRNNDASLERSVLYIEQLPWYIVPLLHTLKTTVSEDTPTSSDDAEVVRFVDDLTRPLLRNLSYQPSVPRTKPFLLEARLRVPASATLRLSFEYDKEFLRYAEHPPDAHRGFDLPPAVIEVLDEEGGPDYVPLSRLLSLRKREKTPRLYTMPGLVEVAVPDFSMPYNVIIMTSTVIALFFGSAFNNFIRTYKDVRV